MKHLLPVFIAVLCVSACGKDKPKPVVAVDAGAGLALKQDDDLASKLSAAYPKIRCALAAGQNATATLYTDLGFADATAYFRAFEIQAKANPEWARRVTEAALAHPCVEPAAAATPTAAPDATGAAQPATGNAP